MGNFHISETFCSNVIVLKYVLQFKSNNFESSDVIERSSYDHVFSNPIFPRRGPPLVVTKLFMYKVGYSCESLSCIDIHAINGQCLPHKEEPFIPRVVGCILTTLASPSGVF